MASRVGSLKSNLVATAGWRIALLPVSAGATIAVQYLALQTVGIEKFGVLSLVTSLPLLLPFLDLGMGTSLINSYASGDLDSARRQTSMAWSLLWCVAGSVLIIGLVLQWLVGWQAILGVDVFFAGVTAPIIFLVLSAIVIPMGIGARILVGLGQVTRVAQVQILFPIVTASLGLVAFATSNPALFIVAPAVGQIFVAAGGLFVATRETRYGARYWMRLSLRGSSQRRAVFGSAWPMLIISAGVALGLQSHRIVLAHLSTGHELSRYSVVMILFTPALSLANQVIVNLWPYFARTRASDRGPEPKHIFKKVLRRGIGGLALYSLLFLSVAPGAVYLLTGSLGGLLLWISLALLLFTQGVQGIYGMFLTKPRELRFQALCIVGMVCVSFGLMGILTPSVGAAGPVLAAVAAVWSAQILPSSLYLRRAARENDRPLANGDSLGRAVA